MNTMDDDLIERSVNIHWPDDFDPDRADLFAHNAIVINAAAERIWAKLITSEAWPTWYSNGRDVVVDDSSGQLGEDVTINWTTFGLVLLRVQAFGFCDKFHAAVPRRALVM